MALYGVLADIHGNREALAAVLETLAQRGADQLLCLGDVVGYNADPDECVAMVQSSGALSITGNHDLIGLGQLDLRRCSGKAAYALKRTRRSLAPHTRAYLRSLPPHRFLEEGIVLVHGGVRDVQQYMVTPGIVRSNAVLLQSDFPAARLCFFGHSHEQKIYRVDGDRVEEIPLRPQVRLSRSARYFVNPGSVDASRKRGPKVAECAILDSFAWTVEFLAVPYDAAASEAKAAVFGYRMAPWTERVYGLARRLSRAL